MKRLLTIIAAVVLSASALAAQNYREHLCKEGMSVGVSMFGDGNFTNCVRIPDFAVQISWLWIDCSTDRTNVTWHYGLVVPLVSDYVNVIPVIGETKVHETWEGRIDWGFILQGKVPLNPKGLYFTTSYEHTNRMNMWLFGLKYSLYFRR